MGVFRGRTDARHKGARVRRGLVVLGVLVAVVLGVVVPAGPAVAVCPPGVTDGRTAPVPVFPGRGLGGALVPEPDTLALGDPLDPGSGVSLVQAYGVGWARWSTYDLGCGGGALDPHASADTWVGNQVLVVVQAVAGLAAVVTDLAYRPSGWLSRLDPALVKVSSGLAEGFTTVVGPLLVIAAGLFLVWSARRLRLARALSVGVGVVAALTVVFFALGAPVAAGSAADTVLEDATADVSTRFSGIVGPRTDDPADAVAGPFVDHVLYEHWLAGLLGSSTSPVAVRYGPELFRSQAVSWAEADQVAGDEAATARMVTDKQAAWEAAAAGVEEQDPDAYAYLTGGRGSRAGQAIWVLAAAQTLLLPIAASAVMIAGYLTIRFLVMTAPAWAVVAVLPQQQKRLRQATNLAATALITTVTTAAVVTAHSLLTTHLMNPTTGLGWLGTFLAVLVSKLTWTLTKPLHTLYSLITGKPTKKRAANASQDGRTGAADVSGEAARQLDRVGAESPSAASPTTAVDNRSAPSPSSVRDAMTIGPGTVISGARVIHGRFPRTSAGARILARVGVDGLTTNYQVYDEGGFPAKRVDLVGRPHGGVQTPHVVEFERHTNPTTGETFVRPRRLVRPASPEEVAGLERLRPDETARN
jgi:hypothetical protein